MAHTYRHESGETVRVVDDGSEDVRLRDDESWSLVDEDAEEPAKAQPRRSRSSSSSSSSSASSDASGEG